MSGKVHTWGEIRNFPVGELFERDNATKNLQQMLSSISQQNQPGGLLEKLPLVYPPKIDTSKMIKLPLKDGGELYLGATEEWSEKKVIIGFSGERFGSSEVFIANITKYQTNEQLNNLKISSLSPEVIRKCGKINPAKKVDWSQVDPEIADLLEPLWNESSYFLFGKK